MPLCDHDVGCLCWDAAAVRGARRKALVTARREARRAAARGVVRLALPLVGKYLVGVLLCGLMSAADRDFVPLLLSLDRAPVRALFFLGLGVIVWAIFMVARNVLAARATLRAAEEHIRTAPDHELFLGGGRPQPLPEASEVGAV